MCFSQDQGHSGKECKSNSQADSEIANRRGPASPKKTEGPAKVITPSHPQRGGQAARERIHPLVLLHVRCFFCRNQKVTRKQKRIISVCILRLGRCVVYRQVLFLDSEFVLHRVCDSGFDGSGERSTGVQELLRGKAVVGPVAFLALCRCGSQDLICKCLQQNACDIRYGSAQEGRGPIAGGQLMLLNADWQPEQQERYRAREQVAVNIVEIEFFDQAITCSLRGRLKTIGKARTLPHRGRDVTHFLE